MEVRNPTTPSLNDVGFHGVSPNLQRAIAYLSRLGGGNGTQHHHLSVILGFTLVSPNLPRAIAYL
ncbi:MULTISPECIES: hypothetical protein [Limnospira]|uniref:hypothetical protein n=1 Tax=Limnospira TaxID=2596745 RepID=UPI000D3CD6E2|nr:hypothetical protein HFV01_17015 [Limnospira fusiformis SAG 85.79]